MVKLSTSDQLLVTWSEINWLLLITSEKLATSNLLLFDNRSQLPVNIYIKYYRCLKLYEVFNIINTMTIVLDKMQGVIRYRSQQSQILKTFDNIISQKCMKVIIITNMFYYDYDYSSRGLKMQIILRYLVYDKASNLYFFENPFLWILKLS